eukprot:5660819-Amphidinium_carterae.2
MEVSAIIWAGEMQTLLCVSIVSQAAAQILKSSTAMEGTSHCLALTYTRHHIVRLALISHNVSLLGPAGMLDTQEWSACSSQQGLHVERCVQTGGHPGDCCSAENVRSANGLRVMVRPRGILPYKPVGHRWHLGSAEFRQAAWRLKICVSGTHALW